MAVSVSPKTGVGTRLKEARRERGVTLEHAAQKTKIKPRFLRALESDAPPSAFRAPVYARAFLREYARFLGVDPDPLVREYALAHGAPGPRPLQLPRSLGRRSGRRVLRWMLVLVSVGLLATLAVTAARQSREPPPSRTPSEAERAVAPVPPQATEVVLRLRVADRRTWLRVAADGRVAVRGRQARGFDRTFRADERIGIEVADAGAVRLWLDGERIGRPGKKGITYRAAFVLRDGAVEVEER